MIGKIFYEKEWHLCRFENDILDVLHTVCKDPNCLIGAKVKFTPNAVIASFEDGSLRFFDLRGVVNTVQSEYTAYRFTNPNYFKTKDTDSYNIKNLNSISKISFKNGVLKPMLELSHIPDIEIEVENIPAKVCFRVKKANDNILCDMTHGKMLSNNPSRLTEYRIDICFKKRINIEALNIIVDRLNKLVQVINIDYNAPIGSVEVKTNIGVLLYFKSGIHYAQQPIVRYNFIANCKSIIQELVKNIMADKYDLGFLVLIDKDFYTPNDYWVLAQSIENNINIKDVDLQSPILSDEVLLYKNLKTAIGDTINTFEKNNGNIYLDKKNFILSMIELPRFRQKVEYIFERFNAFANNYSKYSAIDDQDIQIYSKQIGFARNTIHGQLNEKFDSKKAEEGAMLTIIGLYLYILEDCNASSACQFNLIQCMFSH